MVQKLVIWYIMQLFRFRYQNKFTLHQINDLIGVAHEVSMAVVVDLVNAYGTVSVFGMASVFAVVVVVLWSWCS